jgi:hypothetical protein
MILQTNPALPEIIRKYGCGLMCIIWHSARLSGCTISGIADILDIYNESVSHGAMDANCFIRNWDAVFSAAGLGTEYTGRHEPADRDCRGTEIEILRFPGHFVAGDGRGNVTYDPWGVSRAISQPMRSKRIFKV